MKCVSVTSRCAMKTMRSCTQFPSVDVKLGARAPFVGVCWEHCSRSILESVDVDRPLLCAAGALNASRRRRRDASKHVVPRARVVVIPTFLVPPRPRPRSPVQVCANAQRRETNRQCSVPARVPVFAARQELCQCAISAVAGHDVLAVVPVSQDGAGQ